MIVRDGDWYRQIKRRSEEERFIDLVHHCVATYRAACTNGSASIWSLTCQRPPNEPLRCLTIEVRSDGRIAQCRGFANRQGLSEEMAIVHRWARENDFKLTW